MEGAFSFRAREPGREGETASSLLDGPWPENFEARVARFYLVAAESEVETGANAGI